jgi:hypothetical protein
LTRAASWPRRVVTNAQHSLAPHPGQPPGGDEQPGVLELAKALPHVDARTVLRVFRAALRLLELEGFLGPLLCHDDPQSNGSHLS